MLKALKVLRFSEEPLDGRIHHDTPKALKILNGRRFQSEDFECFWYIGMDAPALLYGYAG